MTPSSAVDVAIVGAGPYGLSLATHLKERGVEHRIFGTPMDTWRKMAPGMCLKSVGFATSIFTPDGHPTLPEYCREHNVEDHEPIEISTFERYGASVQKDRVSYLEEVQVTSLRQTDGKFELRLDTGESVKAGRVVVAVGLTYFARLPPPLNGLPGDLVSHTAHCGDYSGFAGSNVTVVGAGQSALEAAALLREIGAEVQLLVRRTVKWGGRGKPDEMRSLIERVRVPNSTLGHGRDNWVLQHFPTMMHYMPTERRLQFTRTHLGPGGSWWLRDRVDGKLPIHTGTSILDAKPSDGKVCLTVGKDRADCRELKTDYVIAGTGYEVDVDRIDFIGPELAGAIQRVERAPRLSRHFESSVPGLFFMGLSSAASFGPLFRFVAGSAYAAPAMARHLAPRGSRRFKQSREGT